MNRKQVCDCKNENYNKSSNFASFFLMGNYNNRFDPKYTNPKTQITNGTIKNLNTERAGFIVCDKATKQQKLSIRHKPTPYRVPYNHYRKSYGTTDSSGNIAKCITNEKFVGYTPADGCFNTTYAISRITNKCRQNSTGAGDYNSYLQSSGKLYTQNAFGILPENKVSDSSNLYRINSVHGRHDISFCKIFNGIQ